MDGLCILINRKFNFNGLPLLLFYGPFLKRRCNKPGPLFKKTATARVHPRNPPWVVGLGPEAPQMSYGSAINHSNPF
jgi:hypothetical protein